MKLDKIIHATQYYRTPTPRPNEWEGDISKFEGYNIDAFQIRINWRWNERREGEYDFSDVDALMELAKKYNRKVIIKFLLECAPQYVFDKYNAYIIGPKGEVVRGGAHGAFYGGWRPCFNNPDVRRRAAMFVEKVVERYADCENLILWNVWNEIRNRPIEECFCPNCRREYATYLKNKFGTIEKLNSFYGAAEDSFETIALPSMPHGFWDMYEFKKHKAGDNLSSWLRFVYQAIKKHDTTRPIMTHVGFCAAFQANLGDVCDDFTVSKEVDFYGTSTPCRTKMDKEENRLDFQLLNDYMRCVDPDYFVHEIYPGLGMFYSEYDDEFDMTFKQYSAVSSGAKGVVYWQYRSERVGNEQDCAGLARADGSARDVLNSVKAFGADVHKLSDVLKSATIKPSDVAIVFDFDSKLMGEIEESCGQLYEFSSGKYDLYYRNSHMGMYRALRRLNYGVDYASTTKPENFKNYKVLYFPYYSMLKPDVAKAIEEFVRDGGIVLADDGFGMRQTNTWFNPYDVELKPVITARVRERRKGDRYHVNYNGKGFDAKLFKTEYAVENADVLMTFDDGTPALQRVSYGKGQIYLFGFSIGYMNFDENNSVTDEFIEKLLGEADIKKYKYSDLANGIYERRMVCADGRELVFLFNTDDEPKSVAGRSIKKGVKFFID